MKYALFDFYEEGATDIGPSSWIVDLDEASANNDDFDFDEDVEVQWRGSGSKKNNVQVCPARVLMFSDNKAELRGYEKCLLSNTQDTTTPSKLGRGKRAKKRKVHIYEEDQEDDNEMTDEDDLTNKKEQQKQKAQSVKNFNRKLLEQLKRRSSDKSDSEEEINNNVKQRSKPVTMSHQKFVAVSDDSDTEDHDVGFNDNADENTIRTSGKEKQDTDVCVPVEEKDVIGDLKREVKRLKEENQNLHSALKSLEWLSNALPAIEKITTANNQAPQRITQNHLTGTSQSKSSHTNVQSTSSSQTIAFGSKNVSLSKLAKCDSSNLRKYTLDLMTVVFDRETMVSHTLSGTVANSLKDVSPKPALDKDIVDGIMDHVLKKFNGTAKEVREAIKAKLNNEKKMVAKKKSSQV